MSEKPTAEIEIVEGDVEPAKPSKKKKLIIIGAAASVLLMGGGGAGYMFLGKSEAAAESGDHGEAAPAEGHGEAAQGEGGGHGEGGEATYVEVPPMIVNLRSPDGAARFLKVRFVIVPGTMDSTAINAKLPMLLDAFQPFLRELRPEDLAGSAALFRVKEELMRRSTETLGSGAVEDILIQDLVQQ